MPKKSDFIKSKVRQPPARPRVLDGILCVAIGLMSKALGWNFWLRMRPVDGGCAGEEFAIWIRGIRPKLRVEVVKRPDGAKRFKMRSKLWVVERTFGWLMRHPRLVPDLRKDGGQRGGVVFMANYAISPVCSPFCHLSYLLLKSKMQSVKYTIISKQIAILIVMRSSSGFEFKVLLPEYTKVNKNNPSRYIEKRARKIVSAYRSFPTKMALADKESTMKSSEHAAAARLTNNGIKLKALQFC